MKRAMSAAIAACFINGCAVHASVEPPVVSGNPQHVEIPKGHYPPPGKCRIWFPDRPPGQQPPPGECRELQHRLPPGAVLVKG